METLVSIKTNRAKRGYANGHIRRFMNYSTNKITYSFQFYQTHKFFKTYRELREFVESNYQMVTGWDNKEYHLPEDRHEFFK